MLTIKQITSAGDEFLFPALSVRYSRKHTETGYPMVEFEGATNGVNGSFDSGVVFVMNELGKTVSRYDLSACNVSFHVDPVRSA